MSVLKKMLSGSLVGEDTKGVGGTKDLDSDAQLTDIFEGGHRLTALENIGSSLTTLWSNCSLKVISSKNSLNNETNSKSEANTANNVSGTIREDISKSDLKIIYVSLIEAEPKDSA